MPNILDYNPRFANLNTSDRGASAWNIATRSASTAARERARLDVEANKQKLWPYNIMSLMSRIERQWGIPKEPEMGVNVRIRPSGPSLMKGTGYDSTQLSEAQANAQIQRSHDSINMGGRAVGEFVDNYVDDPFKEVKQPKMPKWAESIVGYDNMGEPVYRVKYKDPYLDYRPRSVVETYEDANGEIKTRLRQTSRDTLPERAADIRGVTQQELEQGMDYGGGRDLFEGEAYQPKSTLDWLKNVLGYGPDTTSGQPY